MTNDKGSFEGAVAIIGIGCRLPNAADPAAFWTNLRNGVESTTTFSDTELRAAGVREDMLSRSNYVRSAAILDDIDLFDAEFFGLTRREAEITDPQHRLFLECAWETLEDAAVDPARFDGAIGVFAGCRFNTYLARAISQRDALGRFFIMVGNEHDHLALRTSYKLNLTGPSVTVQTSCSSSLVAVHMACQTLLTGEADLVLAGGSAISIPQSVGYLHEEGSILSPDGHCRAFDKRAEGTYNGNGVGIVALRRLDDAVRDGDPIRAIIRGSAVNNDGNRKVAYSAPSVEGQRDVITEALGVAGVDPRTISYVETHGTATRLGDPIEIAALTEAFRLRTRETEFCGVGSVKTNIGHLDAAAGVAGLIKTVLALESKTLPASLHFEAPNPSIDFTNSPFYVVSKTVPWPRASGPRRACVSSFGIGGTNAHVVLEEAPLPAQRTEGEDPIQPPSLVVLSARTAPALAAVRERLAAWLREHPDTPISDVAYSLAVGRRGFACRTAIVAADNAALERGLERHAAGAVAAGESSRIAFVFPGQGTQYAGMGAELYQHVAAFRPHFEECCEAFRPHLETDLRDLVTGQISPADLEQTSITQPALFAIEFALASMFREWGIKPDFLLGHSLGELVAATVAGVFDLHDAALIVAARGRLMQSMPASGMLAVRAAEHDLREWLDQQSGTFQLESNVSIAAVNGPRQCVIAGPLDVLRRAATMLENNGIKSVHLRTSHAFHSFVMDPVCATFKELIGTVRRSPPTIPVLSNVTGTWLTNAAAVDPSYWATQLRATARYGDCLAVAATAGSVLIEVGPGTSTGGLVTAMAERPRVVSTLPEADMEVRSLLQAVGDLWTWGYNVDWHSFYQRRAPRRVALPTYPFERQRYWIEASLNRAERPPETATVAAADVSRWLYTPVWKQQLARTRRSRDERLDWFVLAGSARVGQPLCTRLRERGHRATLIIVSPGEPSGKDHESLRRLGQFDRPRIPPEVLYVVPLEESSLPDSLCRFVSVSQALARNSCPVNLTIVTSGVHSIVGGEVLRPELAAVEGAMRVLSQEHSDISCRSIDIQQEVASGDEWVDELLPELLANRQDATVALRNGRRWRQTYEALDVSSGPAGVLQSGAAYLITGGLGKIGLAIAESFARQAQVTLWLAGRSDFPERQEWSAWLEQHPCDDACSRKIARLLALEQIGSTVVVERVDIANEAAVREMMKRIHARGLNLRGLIHAAGVSGAAAYRALEDVRDEDVIEALGPKAVGVRLLDRYLDARPLDFCVAFSSLASLLGGLGFTAYAAANAAMDATVEALRATRPEWLSINWDGWDFGTLAGEGGLISVEQGQVALQRLLESAVTGRVAISATPLTGRLKKWVERPAAGSLQSDVPPTPTAFRAPNAPTFHGASGEDLTERALAVMWQELFGLDSVETHANFFEIGGDSLAATVLISRIRKSFEVDIPLRTVFEAPTISRFAQVLRSSVQSEARLRDLARKIVESALQRIV